MSKLKKIISFLLLFLPIMGYSQLYTVDNQAVLITDKTDNKQLRSIIYPNTQNPTRIYIGFDNFSGNPVTVSIRDANNYRWYKRMFSADLHNMTLKLDTANLPNGIYTITVRNKDTTIVKIINVSSVQVHEEKRVAMLD